MYERFTDRSCKVMQLANQAAQRLNHEYIGTEHMLIGLVNEGAGVASHVLKSLGISSESVIKQVYALTIPGPDMVTLGKMPQTPRAKRACEFAIEEARNMGHNYVGTEHLLLGLLREGEGVAAQVLLNLGITSLDKVRDETLHLLGFGLDDAADPVLNLDAEHAKFVAFIRDIAATRKRVSDLESMADDVRKLLDVLPIEVDTSYRNGEWKSKAIPLVARIVEVIGAK